MKALSMTLLAAGLLMAAGPAAANPTIVRGYDTCIGKLEAAHPRSAKLVHARYYYHAMTSDDMSYYVNSSAWQDGDRVKLRTLCTTDRFGRKLLQLDSEPGTWMPDRGIVNVEEVASR